MPCLYVIAGPDEGTLFKLEGDSLVTIGRGDDATMQLVDERSSRVHCGVSPKQVIAGDFGIPVKRWALSDQGSSNGTRIGAERIDGDAVLEDGDVIGLGRTSVVFLSDACDDRDTAEARCSSLGIDSGTLADGGWPLENPAARGTLQDD
jgi:pSer/pThr/pTyr-binding forkhead associated (FHA) protein